MAGELEVHAIECDGPPTSPPVYVNQHWTNTDTGEMWLSNGTDSVSNWIQIKWDSDTDVNLYMCDPSVVVGEMVYVSANDTVDKAIADDAKKLSIGVVIEKPTPSTARVQSNGKALVFSGLTAGDPVFLSDSTLGEVTQNPITASGNWLQQVGIATSAESVSLEINSPIRRS